MRIRYIAVQPFEPALSKRIEEEEKRFRLPKFYDRLYYYERALKMLLSAPLIDEKLLKDLWRMYVGDCRRFLYLQPLLGYFSSGNVAFGDRNVLRESYIRVKCLRQEYWLAWLMDIFCEQIEKALERCEESEDGVSDYLYCIALPEFTFVDYGLTKDGRDITSPHGFKAFYMSVIDKFLEEKLIAGISRTSSGMRTFQGLQRRFKNGKRQIVLFAGTIIGKKHKEEGVKVRSIYYNMAPVFFDGKCTGIWEKQTISPADGKSFKEQHKHLQLYGAFRNAEPEEKIYVASDFSKSYMQGKSMRNIRPIFHIPVFGIQLRFALCVCLDYASPEIFLGDTADVYVLIACGMHIYSHIKEIPADVKLFLYCDAVHGSNQYRQACFSLYDPRLEFDDGQPPAWSAVKMDKMGWCYNNLFEPDLLGIYIEPEAIDGDPLFGNEGE